MGISHSLKMKNSNKSTNKSSEGNIEEECVTSEEDIELELPKNGRKKLKVRRKSSFSHMLKKKNITASLRIKFKKRKSEKNTLEVTKSEAEHKPSSVPIRFTHSKEVDESSDSDEDDEEDIEELRKLRTIGRKKPKILLQEHGFQIVETQKEKKIRSLCRSNEFSEHRYLCEKVRKKEAVLEKEERNKLRLEEYEQENFSEHMYLVEAEEKKNSSREKEQVEEENFLDGLKSINN